MPINKWGITNLSGWREIKIRYDKECEVYVAHYPILNIYAQGETWKKAKQALADAIDLYYKVYSKIL